MFILASTPSHDKKKDIYPNPVLNEIEGCFALTGSDCETRSLQNRDQVVHHTEGINYITTDFSVGEDRSKVVIFQITIFYDFRFDSGEPLL